MDAFFGIAASYRRAMRIIAEGGRVIKRLLLIALLALLAGPGCVSMVDYESSQEYRASVVAAASEGQTIGQSFVSRRTGLDTVYLWIQLSAPKPDPEATVTVKLFTSPETASPLIVHTIPAVEVQAAQPVKVRFPARQELANTAYYLEISARGCQVQALGRAEDSYANGSLYMNRAKQQGDLSFRIGYAYGTSTFLEDLAAIFMKLPLAAPLAGILFLPGWIVLHMIGLHQRRDSGEIIALSLGLSLACIALLFTWATLFGVHLNRWLCWAGLGVAATAAGWLAWQAWQQGTRPRLDLLTLTLLAAFLLTLWVRAAMVRDLAASPWVDSVHHAMLVRMIAEQGRFPSSYAPYLSVGTSSYHAGFHAATAVFLWLSGYEVQRGLLVFGQALNALAIFPVYHFTKSLTGSRQAGLVAALVVGFITPMPAYYTSWGRYTQLAGFLILAPALIIIQEGFLSSQSGIRRLSLQAVVGGSLAVGGLMITHYRILAFLGLWVLAWVVIQMVIGIWSQQSRQSLLQSAPGLFAVAVGASVISLPWWPPAVSTLIIPKLSWSQAPSPFFGDFSWRYLTSALGGYALGLAGAGLLWCIIRRKRWAFQLTLWIGLLFFAANLAAMRLPGGHFINNTSVEILLFLPIATCCGALLSELHAWIQSCLPGGWLKAYRWSIFPLGALMISAGARELLPLINPATVLFRQGDEAAMRWIAVHIPPDESILINPFAWGYGLYAGNDGGYWIAPLAGRKTVPPPALYGLDESADELRQIASLSRSALDYGENAVELHRIMRQQGLRYIYSGIKGGAISPGALDESPLFQALYHADNAWVFEALP